MAWFESLIDWVKSLPTFELIALGVGSFVFSFFASIGAVTWFILRLPHDYFQNEIHACKKPAKGIGGWLWLIGENIIGLLLIIIGVILSLPGVPGQGFLTILIGLMFLSFPGKRRFEKAIIRRRHVLNGVNRIRSKFNKAPILPCE